MEALSELPVTVPPGETPAARWGRRALTFPGVALGLALLLAAAPLLLPLAAAVDLLRRARFATARAYLVVLLYLSLEVGGLVGLGLLVAGGAARGDRARLFRFQRTWAAVALRAIRWIFSLRLEVVGLEGLRHGPILLMGNHTSMADVLLPAALVEGALGYRLRYVGKLGLVWDPCVDVAVHHLPYVMVRRGAEDTPGDVARMQALLVGLGPDEGVFLMPEGTRFTPERQGRISRGNGPVADLARRLPHTLPPRLSGVLGLLERNPGADPCFMAQVGLDGVRSLADVWDGALIGRTLKVEFWRVPCSEVPRDREAQAAWFLRQWERIDAWVGREREAAAGAVRHDPSPRPPRRDGRSGP